jgi:hypothetical protein
MIDSSGLEKKDKKIQIVYTWYSGNFIAVNRGSQVEEVLPRNHLLVQHDEDANDVFGEWGSPTTDPHTQSIVR